MAMAAIPLPAVSSASPLHHQPCNTLSSFKASHLSNGIPIKNPEREMLLRQAMRSIGYRSSEGVDLNSSAFHKRFLSLCIDKRALFEGIQLREYIDEFRDESEVFVENQFLNLYAKCGEMDMARKVFDEMALRNRVSWNLMAGGYCLNEMYLEALQLFKIMLEVGPMPDESTFLSCIRAVVGSGNYEHGEQVHALVIKMGFFMCTRVGNALIGLYAKLGDVKCAETVFNAMVERDEVSSNSIIMAYARNSYEDKALELLVRMLEEGLRIDEFVYGSTIGLGDLHFTKQLHTQILKSGFGDHTFVGSALLDAYRKRKCIQDAYLVFNRMHSRNLVTWNSIIAAFTENDQLNEGWHLFMLMRDMGLHPDKFTMCTLLKAVGEKATEMEGKQLHVLTIKTGLDGDCLISNTLITMYAKNGQIFESRMVFDSISSPDLVSWNAIIQSCVENETYEEALSLFKQMRHLGQEPDQFTFVSIFTACTSVSSLAIGRGSHGYLVKINLVLGPFIGSSLVDMYAKFGALQDAQQVFGKIKNKDLITYNTMIAGFSQNGYGQEALELFCIMRKSDIEPDNFTFASIISGCSDVAAIQHGKQVHALLLKLKVSSDVAVANSLITMYSNFGSIEEAEEIFSNLEEKNTISWTSMIRGYAQLGCAKEAIKLFHLMSSREVKPNGLTFLALLTACSHAGMVDGAKTYFMLMESDYGIQPNYEHYACMVDVLGRAGRLEEAEDVIHRMPYQPTALVWKILLSSCRTHGDLERGKRLMEQIIALEPTDSAAYVLLSNMYAAVGKWEGVAQMRKLMKENGARKETGKSWIEVENKVHEFVAGDRSHPQADKIYCKLRQLLAKMKVEGYVPNTTLVLHDLDEQVKENLICCHSERLAVAFGLISLGPKVPIRVFKNLRICADCHEAMKYMSKIVCREIVIRDPSRFHQFKDGLCSCSEYW